MEVLHCALLHSFQLWNMVTRRVAICLKKKDSLVGWVWDLRTLQAQLLQYFSQHMGLIITDLVHKYTEAVESAQKKYGTTGWHNEKPERL